MNMCPPNYRSGYGTGYRAAKSQSSPKYQVQKWKFIQNHDVCKRCENGQSRSMLNRSDRFDWLQARKAGWRKFKLMTGNELV
jgi:hypothetical protein